MALRARHIACAAKLAESFDLPEEACRTFVKSQAEKWTDFFLAKGTSHLLVYYQPKDVRIEDGSVVAGTGEPRLHLTLGEDEALRGKAVYFIRATDKPIDQDKPAEPGVLVGEIGTSPLAQLETQLVEVYERHITDRAEWGRIDEESKKGLHEELKRAATSVTDTRKSLATGLELSKAPDGLDLDEVVKASVAHVKAKKSPVEPDQIAALQALLETWSGQIEVLLRDLDAVKVDHSEGPRGILHCWRNRVRKLTSVLEQFKRRDVRSVLMLLGAVAKGPPEKAPATLFAQLRRWKELDVIITESSNEARDNVKYLSTLEQFFDVLYHGEPQAIIDALPALMNSVKMIHTIARYFNTDERMTDLFVKITHALIDRCSGYVIALEYDDYKDNLWKKSPAALLPRLEECLQVNELYQETFRLTREKLSAQPRGKQFDTLNEAAIFGRIDSFCRRVLKLIDLFSTITQYAELKAHQVDGLESLVKEFDSIVSMLQARRHPLMVFTNTEFDRDYVEFNVSVDGLEIKLQKFITDAFATVKSVASSLDLLRKFEQVLKRESLASDLNEKAVGIFHAFGRELELVQAIYEEQKHNPPKPRNMPPVAGNIAWSRNLLLRIEDPMTRFETLYPHVFASKEGKAIVKSYNKIARTLVAYEVLWYNAWAESVETAKAGLQATLVIRHPVDRNLYVNFDAEILQLIRETKCLARMGLDVPESARIIMMQEDKFKRYYNELSSTLREFNRISKAIMPVIAPLLKPALADFELQLRPGMITLTWTSMNIDMYKAHVAASLARLDELVRNVNDIVENRIESNLRKVAKTVLVDLPHDRSFSLDEFVVAQQEFVAKQTQEMVSKNSEIERATRDLIELIDAYEVDAHIPRPTIADYHALVEHYCHFMQVALLHCYKASLNALRKRVATRKPTAAGTPGVVEKPFFDLELQLQGTTVVLSPSLDDVQHAINRSAIAVLASSAKLRDWSAVDISELGVEAGPADDDADDDDATIDTDTHSTAQVAPRVIAGTFYPSITKSMEIVRVVLLLTCSIQGARAEIASFINTFDHYKWLWAMDPDQAYKEFLKTNPSNQDYETALSKFAAVEESIGGIAPLHVIGALSLNTVHIQKQLRALSHQFKVAYSDNLHKAARSGLNALTDLFKSLLSKLGREPDALPSIKFLMDTMKDIRELEAVIDLRINPVMDMYSLLELHMADGYMDKAEMDQRAMLRVIWGKVLEKSQEVMRKIVGLQSGFRKRLLADVKLFRVDAQNFREVYLAEGPGVVGISPTDAMERLRRYEDEFDILQRKRELYSDGEDLFALTKTPYPELDVTAKELQLLGKLYGLYKDVMTRMDEWRSILWTDVVANITNMANEMESFSSRCKKLPGKLKGWDAYSALNKRIEDAQNILPLLQELSKPSLRPRHWEALEKIIGRTLNVTDAEFKLAVLLDSPLVDHKDEVVEITDGADKELMIQKKMEDIIAKWSVTRFFFAPWKARGVSIIAGAGAVLEELEESQMNLQTMLTMRNVGFFREQVQAQLTALSDTSEQLELWQKVQMLWCSLESVFLGGDIAKQMPVVAKRFQKIDKDFTNIMQWTFDHSIVTEACANEILKMSLPAMFEELEKCQKSLEGYLEQKRNKFPRFYFVSNPVLLQILSQGSDPQAIQAYYEKVFDSISCVEHDKKEKIIIRELISREGRAEEHIALRRAVKATGNIEDWLMDLLHEMQRTMKELCEECAVEISFVASDLSTMRRFVDRSCGQYALLGLQMMWTSDTETALATSRKDKNAMRDANNKSVAVLQTLSSWCLQDLGSKMNRTKIETLVTVQVHMRDVSGDLWGLHRAKRISGADDFEWLKQMRFYWNPDATDSINDKGACTIKVTDVPFEYQYEYLGCKERLVITPLTDRCYITLAQAMGMHYGGSPAGPAGTGKTETVKDMGRSIGIYVVVTNCTDQMRYLDCAKIFKGLCMAGLWGCFDEFNRITLPVLSVVAQQVLAILNAKKANATTFNFPGDTFLVNLNPAFGAFITMNPGYAGRQELPENLKALFRGVAMMVPDREIIMKVKLCSVGYLNFSALAHKFFVCYQLCEEQLSKQKHYDFGLRNILSVLRTAGATKRENLADDEEKLLYRTLRDMNMSKLVAQDVQLFSFMLMDLFPGVESPAKREYVQMGAAIKTAIADAKLVAHPSWVNKIIQLYETNLVRHGIMLVGPTAGGKSRILEVLQASIASVEGKPVKIMRLNPKAIQAHEMYGQTDPVSGEWVKGVFAAIWEKYNNRELPYTTWVTCDGPVDAIWIEDLNSVLDDNKLLTLASGDRIPMTDNVKILFETESLANASPATVSRAGIIFVSDTDLDWKPILEGWLNGRQADLQPILRSLFLKLVGDNTAVDPGHLFDFIIRQCTPAMNVPRAPAIMSTMNLCASLMEKFADAMLPARAPQNLEKVVLYALAWAIGGILEADDRVKFDAYLRKFAPDQMPVCAAGTTIYEYVLESKNGLLDWQPVKAPAWSYPTGDRLDFSNLLVPTMDSTRSLYVVDALHRHRKPVMLIGGPGTAKTSSALMYFRGFDVGKHVVKRVNFSSATTPGMFQESIDSELDKRGGKNFGPPGGKRMTVFIDDVSMPAINTWGDQPTNELVRQLIEAGGYYFLDKDKRGDFKITEDLQYLAAMNHPGGGRNDIPNRLKRQFFVFNLVLPALASIDDLYGQMLRGRFPAAEFSPQCCAVATKLTSATIDLWRRTKAKMLPTPAKFHYIFNMRELSRVFQGVLLTPKDTIKTGGKQTPSTDQAANLLKLWKHECSRVFEDKLTNNPDKEWFRAAHTDVIASAFGPSLAATISDESFFVDFFRDDEYDEDETLIAEAPKIYESGGTLANVKARVEMFMKKHNDESASRKLELVLFDDALRHLIRIARILATPRGCALLVGVGGSGKQSLTRLAAYIARQRFFQITLTKTYNVNSLKEDLKVVYRYAGKDRKPITFLMTDAEIKDEAFLEYMNSILLTGDVAGLFAKDEMMGMTAELQGTFAKDRPGIPDTPDNLKQYFIDCVRDNLHVVLCMSPVNVKFPERARRFPGLISGTLIDWFLPWPEEALTAVSRGLLSDYAVEAEPAVKECLMLHMGAVHSMVVQVCDEYFGSNRRHVYQTPKSFLQFLSSYKTLYAQKLAETKKKEENVNRGLEKLIQGAKDVEELKKQLAEQTVKLAQATADTNKLLASLEVRQAEAQRESQKVAEIRRNCEAEAARIASEKHACEADLAAAQPIVDRAVTAVNSIKPADINEIKKIGKPSDIIRVIFDCVILLFQKPIGKVQPTTVLIKKREFECIDPSFAMALPIMSDTSFLKNLQTFNKDGLNEETVELLKPYTEMPEFDPAVAKAASNAAEGLCTWCIAMGQYYYASKFVKPKLEALAVAEAQLAAAQHALDMAAAREAEILAVLAKLKADFDRQIAEKMAIETNAAALLKKMEQASALIQGLAGERVRWTEDSRMFADVKRRLLGDCAVASAFISYCGPFNSPYRHKLVTEKFIGDCKTRGVPVTATLDVINFLVDIGTTGDWNLQGLPTDPLSTQNGILVTRSARYPLLIDPQGQAITWLRNMEDARLPKEPVLPLSHPKLKETVEFCLSEGRALIIVGVEEELDPLLDPVLERAYTIKGRKRYVKLADQEVEVHDEFSMYFVTRLPNPHFSPELQAKCAVIDFTVTMKGLEEQLLGRVIAREQAALEKLLTTVLSELNSNTKSLLEIDALLLDRLSSNSGNLLDDETLIDVLSDAQKKAAEVKEKLLAADETKRSINEKREQFRPVATRGSVLYFSIVEMSQVNCMYQTSLAQFLDLFSKSMSVAEKSNLASKRVQNIIESMTYIAYRYINRGLYERDKQLFVFLVAVKIMITAGQLDAGEVSLFLRGGAALDIATVRKKPTWMAMDAWLNAVALSQDVSFFETLPDAIFRNEPLWRKWYEDNEPEQQPVPDFETAMSEYKDIGPWRRLLLIRSLRMDRTLLSVRNFLREFSGLGEKFVEPVTDTLESIFEESVSTIPVTFLLSIGADPTEAIEQLAKKKKQSVHCISMGEGQEPVAQKAINAAAVNGTWVLLQNCELGLELMDRMEDILVRMRENVVDDFRLFLTALPHPKFPLGLLQMSTKVTNEPPSGMRAGLLRSYQTLVDQDRLERIDTPQWRKLVYVTCFLHSVVQERRKFGPLGWGIPYEFGSNDAMACLLFLERHMYGGQLSWSTIQYMVAEVQYGGKVTDNMDRRLFGAYANAWYSPKVLDGAFTFNPAHPITRIPGDFKYEVPNLPDVDKYRAFTSSFPQVDTPEIYGLHPNADLTFRVKEATAMITTLADTQPKQSSASGGKSLDEVVMDKAAELLEKLPLDFIEEEYKARIKKLGGVSEPLNIFLFQEIQRFQAVIARVRSMLQAMQQAIRGEIVMTSELLQAMTDIFDARVPRSWLYTPGGDEFSWLLPTLGMWFLSLLERDTQLRTWLTTGRPNTYWMAGFSNPQGFLTAMKQEVTRMHKLQAWSLDDVEYYAEVTDMDRADAVRAPPKEGVFVHGLFVEGARWDKKEASLAESEPKKLYASMPVIMITALSKALWRDKIAALGTYYEAPVYRYPARTERYRVLSIALPSTIKGLTGEHWILRGVALLCITL